MYVTHLFDKLSGRQLQPVPLSKFWRILLSLTVFWYVMFLDVKDCTTFCFLLQINLKTVVQVWVPCRCAFLKCFALTTQSVPMERNVACAETAPRDAIHWPRQDNALKLTLSRVLQFYDLPNVPQTGTVLENWSVVLMVASKNAHPLLLDKRKVWCGFTNCKFKLLINLVLEHTHTQK